MWEYIIKLMPKMIVYYDSYYDEDLISLALENGYKINKKDLLKSKFLRKSSLVLEKAIKINPNYIKYFECINDEAVNLAIDCGYIPSIDDLINNKKLGKSFKIIDYLINNGYPEAYKYYDILYSISVNPKIALRGGYVPTINDLKENKSLGCCSEIMDVVLKQDVNAIKYVRKIIKYDLNSSSLEDLVLYAIKNGYKPNIKDVKENEDLAGSSELFKYLILQNPNYIKYYKGSENYIFKMAIDNGYIPSINDLRRNVFLNYSDDIYEILVKKNPNLIFNYRGESEYIFSLAYERGISKKKLISTVKKFPHSPIALSSFIMIKLIDEDLEIINYYKGNDNYVFNYALKKGFIPNEQFCKSNYMNDEVYKKIISIDPSLIRYYHGYDRDLVKKAYDDGFDVDINNFESYSYCVRNVLVSLMIDDYPFLIKYYNGRDLEVFKKAINLGYMPSEESIKDNYFIRGDCSLMVRIVKQNPDYFKYVKCNKTYVKIMALDYVPTYEEVKNDYNLRSRYDVMEKLVQTNVDFVYLCYFPNDKDKKKLLEYALELGYTPKFDDWSSFIESVNCSISLMEKLIDVDINFIKKYKGIDLSVFKLAIKNGYSSNYFKLENNIAWETNVQSQIEKFCRENTDKENDLIIYLINNTNFDLIGKNERLISVEYPRLYSVAIKLGFVPNIKYFNSFNMSYIDDEDLKIIIDRLDIDECINFISSNRLSTSINNYIYQNKIVDVPISILDVVDNYLGNKKIFIANYSKFHNLLKYVDIDEDKFIQYAFVQHYDWFKDMLDIISNNELADFKKVKDYFFLNYYFKNNDYNSVSEMMAFINILKNYKKYSGLCLSIVNNNISDNNILSKLDYLFSNNDTIISQKPLNISDLENIDSLFISHYNNELKNIENKSIDQVKNIICKLLFNGNSMDMKRLLTIYGDTKDLKQLLFNNKNNHSVSDLISEMIIYTSMIESIVYADDKDYLIDMLKIIMEEFSLSVNCMMIFSKFESKMKDLYARELMINLTNINDDGVNKFIDKEMTDRLSIDVLDFSSLNYCLAVHVKSEKESVEQLVNGSSSGKMNTICLSAISNRNQVYYCYNDSSVIFGYDFIPFNSFIQSSTGNMGSNGSIKNNSYEINKNYYRVQRGLFEISSAPDGHNCEILCFREGVCPKYIILPNGREPKKLEIDIARKYGLKFVKTQDVRKEIQNPKKIDLSLLNNPPKFDYDNSEIVYLKELKDMLVNIKDSKRKIALFSDSHALFEPTLAILEDARKKGITEIYSLGDNIGTGPNPKEVLDLLDEYNVLSLKGNHELYVVLGVDELKEHLVKTGGYSDALRNSTWTKAQLTKKQLESIISFPESRIVEIGGMKIYLTHFIQDYNTGLKLQIPDNVDHVFQGHRHYYNDDGFVTTIRGAGIGYTSSDIHMAYYLILTEKADGGYDIQKVKVDYDYKSLYYDIISSDMDEADKVKIKQWAGVSK